MGMDPGMMGMDPGMIHLMDPGTGQYMALDSGPCYPGMMGNMDPTNPLDLVNIYIHSQTVFDPYQQAIRRAGVLSIIRRNGQRAFTP